MAKLISADLANNNLCILEYSTTDGKMLSIETDSFDAKIEAHTYTDIGRIIFGTPITKIGDNAFRYCSNLTSVTIPDSVTTIGVRAFSRCTSLKEFKGKFASEDGRCLIIDGVLNSFAPMGLNEYTIPDSVTTIDRCAFQHCTSLTSVTIPNSITTIGRSAFSDCSSLTSVTIPDSVTTIYSGAFSYCSSLKEFKGKFASEDGRCLIVDGVLNSFAPTGLNEYTIPDSVTTIGDSVFGGCSNLTNITIPNSVTTIGGYVFSDCSSLTSVTIPDSVTTIDRGAFSGCKSLSYLTIGKSVKEIGRRAFEGCSNIDMIICRATTPPKLYMEFSTPTSFEKFKTLVVPTGCEEAYTKSDWGYYLKE